MLSSTFHEGERDVQRCAGTERSAAQIGRHINTFLGDDHAEFLREQPFVVLAAQGEQGRVWASLLVGGMGFARALDERHLLLAATVGPGDPLSTALETPGTRLGLLAIEPDTRTRLRINGSIRRTADGILLTVQEAFGNCPKYIQRRVPIGAIEPARGEVLPDRCALGTTQAALVRAADTFFIASVHPERGADASHRGGRPGFVEVAGNGRVLRFPDYRGNRMFQTLGNLTVDARVGLLFCDWTTGMALQVTGEAQIIWDEDQVSRYSGAERLVDVTVEAVHQQARAMPARWNLIEPWQHNPPVE